MVVSCAIPEIFICSWGRWGRINCDSGKVGKPLPLSLAAAELAAPSCSGPESPALKRADLDGPGGTSFHTPSRLSDLLLRISTARLRGLPGAFGSDAGVPARRGQRAPPGAAQGAGGGQGGGRGTRPRGAGAGCRPPLLAAAHPRPGGAGNWLQRRYFFIINLFFLSSSPSPAPPSFTVLAELPEQGAESPAGSSGPGFKG